MYLAFACLDHSHISSWLSEGYKTHGKNLITGKHFAQFMIIYDKFISKTFVQFRKQPKHTHIVCSVTKRLFPVQLFRFL